MTTQTTTRRGTLRAGLSFTLACAVLVATPGCASTAQTSDQSGAAPSSTVSAIDPSSSSAAGLGISDAWVKAAPSGMTAMFGVLHNTTDADITVVGGSSPSAGRVELHEVAMVDGAAQMRPKPGGLVVPAGGSHPLAPGADHVMLMDLTAPIAPGDQVSVTLKLAGGATTTVSGIAKDFAAGNESYQPSGGMTSDDSKDDSTDQPMDSGGASS